MSRPTPGGRRAKAPPAGAAAGATADGAPGSGAISRSDLKEATFKSLRWATLARIAAQILTVAVGVLLAHLIPPDEFGRVAVTIVVGELALALANQGAGSVLVQRRELTRGHVEATATLAFVVGVLLSLATLLLAPMVTTPLFGEQTTQLFQLLSPAFAIAAVGIVPLAMLERELDFRRISMIEIATVMVSSAASVAYALLGLEAEAYVLGFITGLLAWAVLLVALGPAVLPRWRPREMREVAAFGVPAGLASMAMVGYGNVDYLILGARLSSAQVGFYYRAYTLGVQYETKISDIIQRVAFPVYSRTENADHMRAVRSRIVRINAAVIYPMLALFVAVAPELVPWVFGERWEPAVLPAQILAVAGMARMVNNGTPALLLAAGRPRALLAFNLCRLTALAAAVMVAVPYGLIAVCIAVSIFQVITTVASYALMLPRLVGITLRRLALDLAPAIVASGIMLAAAFPVVGALSAADLPRPLTVLLVSALAAPLYALALRLTAPAAWADLLLLARRVLPDLTRLRSRLPLEAAWTLLSRSGRRLVAVLWLVLEAAWTLLSRSGRRLLAVLWLPLESLPTRSPVSTPGRRLLAVLVASTLIGLLCAALSTGAVGLFPPKLKSTNGLRTAVASTHVLVDGGHPPIVYRREYPVELVVKHAELLGRVMTSPPVLERIGRRAGVDPREIAASVRSTANVPDSLIEPGSEERADQIRRSKLRYRLEVQARQLTPVLDVSAQAPTAEEAVRLANASVDGLRDYLRDRAERHGFGTGHLVQLRQLGSASGRSVVGSGTSMAVGFLAFVLAFLLSGATMLYAIRRRTSAAPIRRTRRAPEADDHDDWPGTTRMLPWMLAGFIAILFLVPFDQVKVHAQLPVDLSFDRLVLPFLVGTWAVALIVGGRVAPRIRLTWIHAAIAAFVVCAFLSVILGARDLSNTLELDRAFKQLPLLVAYVSLFLVAASTVRPTEIRAFLNYGLVLAVICALGMLFEYRFKQNLFYDLSDKLLPGFFSVDRFDAGAVDDIGRLKVAGPTAVPLEAVAMLSMTLPIAIVGLIHSQRWRGRVMYAVAAALLLAAMLATYRKSALLAPISVFLTVAYFRRRELLKLAPLGLVLLVFVHVLAPGALGGATDQFDPSRLGVATVSDRTADYDAVRPDIWTHPIFGRGWGTYDHVSYRILDSELLHRIIEMGVLGLLAFLAMGLAVVLCARATIAARDPRWSPPALIGAAAAVSFLVVSVLFDVLSFPHPTYVFMLMAGVVSVVISQRPQVGERAAERPGEHRGARRHRTSTSRRTRASDEPALAPFAPRR